MRELSDLRDQFAVAPEFSSSPLYTELCRVVSESEPLLHLAARARPGQYPTFLLLGAVHYLLLSGVEHELASFYPSLTGEARPAAGVGPTFRAFCEEHDDELAHLVESRLVQTNAVHRAIVLRYGLAALATREQAPVHLIEVGASAGVHLRSDRFGYRVGDRCFGQRDSPVQIEAAHRGPHPVPDLDALAPLAAAIGVDLNPPDASNPDHRLWLEALVWPDNPTELRQLRAALELIAHDPPTVLKGDAIDLCPRLATTLPPGRPRLVFHIATRMHIPDERLEAFDQAIETLGGNGPLYVLTFEETDQDPRPDRDPPGAAIILRGPDGSRTILAMAGGRLNWIHPLLPDS